MQQFGKTLGDSNAFPIEIVSGPWVIVLLPSLVSYGPSSSQTLLWKVSLCSWYGYIGFYSSGVLYVLLVASRP